MLKLKAKPKNGHLPTKVREAIKTYLEYNDGKDLDIELKRSSKVTAAQYGYLFVAVYPTISAELFRLHGEQRDVYDVDIMMKLKFWNIKSIDPETGEVFVVPNSKTELNKGLMMEFINNIIQWCAVRDIVIPEPYDPEKTYDYAFIKNDLNN